MKRKKILKRLKKARKKVGQSSSGGDYLGLCEVGIPKEVEADIALNYKPEWPTSRYGYWWPLTKKGTKIRKAIIDIYIEKYSIIWI